MDTPMDDESAVRPGSKNMAAAATGAPHSRRQFLKAGLAGAGALAASGPLSSLLAACGSSSTSSQKLGPDTTGTLTIWHYATAGDVTTVENYTKLFQRKFPKVNVQMTYIEFSAYPNRVIAAAGAKSGPDVMIYGGNETVNMYQAGAFYDVDSRWKQFADRDQFPDSVLTSFKNKVYGIKGYVNLTGLWYNKDILDAVGVQPPATFDEVTPALAKVASSGKKYVPIALTGQPSDQGDWTAWPWLSGYGFSYDKPDQSAIEQTYTLVGNWARQGYIPKEAVTWGQAETFTRFAVGDVAFMENGNWNIGPAKSSFKFNYGTADFPKGPKGGTMFLGGEALWVGAFTKHPDLAWAYLESTLLTKAGELITLNGAGSIPARKDMAQSGAIKAQPLVAPFVRAVETRGAEYPPAAGAAAAAQNVVAQNWSAVIAGQKSPQQAAADTESGVKSNFRP